METPRDVVRTFIPSPSPDDTAPAPVLSLATLSLDPISLPQPSPPPAKNKLAAKIAAAKAAKLAAAPAPSAPPGVGTPPEVEGGKKLSKLELKKLAAQAARKGVAPPPTVVPPPPRTPSPPIDALLPTPHFTSALFATSLRAPPSHFASTLAPRALAPSTGDVLARIELALGRDSAIASAGIPAFGGPSPDDVVLNARKGTSLGILPKRK